MAANAKKTKKAKRKANNPHQPHCPHCGRFIRKELMDEFEKDEFHCEPPECDECYRERRYFGKLMRGCPEWECDDD